MKWNQVFGGVLVGLGIGFFLGGAIVDQAPKWNSTSSAGGCMLLVLIGSVAIRRDQQKNQNKKPGPDE